MNTECLDCDGLGAFSPDFERSCFPSDPGARVCSRCNGTGRARAIPAPLAALRHHVSGAIARGEGVAIGEVPAAHVAARGSKVIQFYRVSQWGNVREFVHPSCKGDGAIIRQLTGKETINGVVRELVRDLSGGAVSFVEVVAP